MKLQDQQDLTSNIPDVEQLQNDTFSSIHTIPTQPASHPSYPMPYIFIKNGKMNEKVNYTDILYLHAHGSYCQIVTKTRKYTVSMSLSKVLQQIDCPLLIRCHRSYAVYRDNISSFDDSNIYIANGDSSIELSLSGSYKVDVMGSFMRLKS